MGYQMNKLVKAAQRQEKLLSAIVLSFSIFILWSWLYNVLSFSAWRTPLGYQGDAWLGFAMAKAYMDGDIFPFFFKLIPTLNAPFIANWNDYPITEDFIFAVMGWLGNIIGLFAAGNFTLFLAHLMAGLSFWYVCRELNYKPVFAFSGAMTYAFCHFILARGMGHLVLSFFWHIPLLLLVVQWSYSKHNIPFKSRKFFLAAIISAVCGAFNPYYTGMFLQFMAFVFILHVARKQYAKAKLSIILIGITFTAFMVMNADTILYGLVHGVNIQAAGRNLAALEVYGLKIPELLFPPTGSSPLNAITEFGQKNYYLPSFIKGEFWSPYLGLVPIIGLTLLFFTSFYRFFQGKFKQIPSQFWQINWILIYSLIGGVNLLLGSFGLVIFRATNRYSIFILTIALLYLVRYLSRKCPKQLVLPVALLILVVGLCNPILVRIVNKPPQVSPIATAVASDRNFALSVERQMPNSMVFQLPVAGFPEVGPIKKMGDYEHFRPYLYTKTLHYSYGTNKGRGDTEWQAQAAKLKPADMASKLESYGFGVVIINRKGYEDEGKSLIDGMLAAGKSIIAQNNDLVAFQLRPSITPTVIDSWPKFSYGWSKDEVTHRWSESSRTSIEITNYSKAPLPYVISFKLTALTPRSVKVLLDDKLLDSVNITIPGEEVQFPTTQILLKPGLNKIFFEASAPPINPGNGDKRWLSFKLSEFIFIPSSK